jgi:hypothetical protein
MESTNHEDNLQDKANYLKKQLDSSLLAADNISKYITYDDERNQQNMLIMKYHIKEVSLFLDKIIKNSNTADNKTQPIPDSTANIIQFNNINWVDMGSDDEISNIPNTSIDADDAYCEHDIMLDTDIYPDYISNDMFLKEVKNINDFKNIKFYMENGIDGRPYLHIYKYKNDDTEYYIGDNKCIYNVNKDFELVVYDKYTSIRSDTSQDNKKHQHNRSHSSRNDSRNVNRRNKNSKKKYADFVMMPYFIFRNMVDNDGFNNHDKYKDIQFCFVTDKYGGSGSVPFLLYHEFLLGDNNHMYRIDNDTNNIIDVHTGQRFWRKVEQLPKQ